MLVDYDIFRNVPMPDASDPQRLYNTEDFDFRLKPGSAAVDAGIELPSITDGFTGSAPDLGAYESDRPASALRASVIMVQRSESTPTSSR